VKIAAWSVERDRAGRYAVGLPVTRSSTRVAC